jgi:hypothetical protein
MAKKTRRRSETQEPAQPKPRTEPSVEDIRRRAYQRYLERGGRDGMAFEDWLEAERELKKK